MDRKEVIEILKMENELMTFDPLTGNDISLECLNDLNKRCYEAHEEAIKMLENSIPLDWLKSEVDKSVGMYRICLISLIDNWEKENETDRRA